MKYTNVVGTKSDYVNKRPSIPRPIKVLSYLQGELDYRDYLSYLRSQFRFKQTALVWYTVYSIQFLLDDGRWQMAVLCSVFSIQFCFCVDS